MHSVISHIYSQRVTESAKTKRVLGEGGLTGAQMYGSTRARAATGHFGNLIQPQMRFLYELHIWVHGVNGGQTDVVV